MTKAEAIKETKYSEKYLIKIALIMAESQFRRHWNECIEDNDMDGAEHYMNLVMAYKAMKEEMEQE